MIAEPYGKSMFSFVRNCQIVFQSGCAILYCYQLCLKVPVAINTFLYPSKAILDLCFSQMRKVMQVLQEGGPLPGPETGLLSNTRK